MVVLVAFVMAQLVVLMVVLVAFVMARVALMVAVVALDVVLVRNV